MYVSVYDISNNTMPHVSKHVLNEKTLAQLERYLFNLLMDTTGYERRRIFQELYTATEKLMFAKRIGMLVLIERGESTHTISQMIGVSSSTVARFEIAAQRSQSPTNVQRPKP